MYNTDFLCTYHLIEESGLDAMKDNNPDDLYRIQLLQAFNMHAWDDNAVNSIIQILYNNYKNVPIFSSIIKKGLYYSEDEPIMGFMSLFCYDTFYLLHKCLIDLNLDILNEDSESYINLIKCCDKLNLEKPKV